MDNAMDLFRIERQRQISGEGWTPGHDDTHDDGEMLRAAMIYLHWGTKYAPSADSDGVTPIGWPWDPKWWKPKDRRRNLERAGALMLAESERLRRKRARDLRHIHTTESMRRLQMPPDTHVWHKIELAEQALNDLLKDSTHGK